jgi:hypothetical protein
LIQEQRVNNPQFLSLLDAFAFFVRVTLDEVAKRDASAGRAECAEDSNAQVKPISAIDDRAVIRTWHGWG